MVGSWRAARWFSALVLVFGIVGTSRAEAQTTGTVQGRVTEAGTGTPIVNALVQVRDQSGRTISQTLSNPDGRYRIQNVATGTWTLAVTATGFADEQQDAVQVTPGGTATVDVAMTARAFELQPIQVSASRGAVEKAIEAPSRVEVVTERDIQTRPAVTPVDHLRSTPAVDVISTGMQSTNVVVRGFNNIFSGSLHALTDNRIAGIPSLRVNLMHFIPQTNDDFDRMEVVLGPGSALYGPNTANGVLHILTKSTLTDPQTTFSIAGGERSALSVTGRTSQRISERFGFKVSGQYFRGDEWRFNDPVEQQAATLFQTDPARWRALQPVGLSEAELQLRGSRLAARDFDIQRWAFDVRSDVQVTENALLVLSGGLTNSVSGIELTGIGAGQVQDWKYGYYQARLNSGRLFAQAYLNTSDAGDTYLLRTGAPIVDESKVLVGQLQHGLALGTRQDFIYGGDWIRTTPETGGTINGSREDDDEYDQYGIYLQSKTVLSPKFDLVLAAREDWHTELEDPVFSPRAAVVFKPTEAQSFRVSYNRAFSTPTSLNLFLDIDGGPAGEVLGPFGFRVRAQGPGKNGIRLVGDDGLPLGFRSPVTSGQLVPVSSGNLYDSQLGLLIAALAANPQTAPLVPLMQQLGPAFRGGAEQIGIVTLNPTTQQIAPLGPGSVSNVPGIEPSTSSTFEVGYKGVLGERFLLAADVWRSTEKNFTSPLVLRTPLLLLNPQAFGAYLTQNAAPQMVQALVQSGMPLEQAQQTVTTVITNWVQLPGGVASSSDVAAQGSDLLATYVNFGELDLWGADLSATYLLTDEWSLSGTASFVSDHNFCLVDVDDCPEEQLVALNAPKQKGTATLAYRGLESGVSGEFRVRHTGEFPVNSADFVGLQCIGGGGEECVESYTLVDVSLGYDLPNVPGASLQLAVSNVFDTGYRSFVGVPAIGRFAILRLRYEF